MKKICPWQVFFIFVLAVSYQLQAALTDTIWLKVFLDIATILVSFFAGRIYELILNED